MPALQVRDFPADLYEDLRKFAAREHRSIAQQTIKAVQDMITPPERNERKGEVIEFDSLVVRQQRIRKRKEILETFHADNAGIESDLSDLVDLTHKSHYERDCQIMDMDSADMSFKAYMGEA